MKLFYWLIVEIFIIILFKVIIIGLGMVGDLVLVSEIYERFIGILGEEDFLFFLRSF